MALDSYSIKIQAHFEDNNVLSIAPCDGWNSKKNSVILKLGCGVCDHQVEVTLSKGNVVRFDIPGMARGRYGEANAKTGRCSCGRNEGIVMVDSLAGQDLVNHAATTFMTIRVSNWIPIGVSEISFDWIARTSYGVSPSFSLQGNVGYPKVEVRHADGEKETVALGQVKVSSTV